MFGERIKKLIKFLFSVQEPVWAVLGVSLPGLAQQMPVYHLLGLQGAAQENKINHNQQPPVLTAEAWLDIAANVPEGELWQVIGALQEWQEAGVFQGPLLHWILGRTCRLHQLSGAKVGPWVRLLSSLSLLHWGEAWFRGRADKNKTRMAMSCAGSGRSGSQSRTQLFG